MAILNKINKNPNASVLLIWVYQYYEFNLSSFVSVCHIL